MGDREETVACRETLRLPGLHNIANALAAAVAAMAYGVQSWHVMEALSAFSGLPHRLEMVARGPQAVTYYNDSIATTPESVMCALASFNGPVTLIAGGSDKGCPLDELGLMIARQVRRLILMGTTGPKIQEAVVHAARALKCGPLILTVRDLEQAVQVAASGALPGEAILLSPAAASFDMFRNFEERGERFRALARRTALSAG
jgi:UDP-N-acetylmuramoylalanine--D-glutamate ligase